MKKKLEKLFENADICINLIGILYEKKKEILLKIFIHYFHLYYLNFQKNINLNNLFIYLL